MKRLLTVIFTTMIFAFSFGCSSEKNTSAENKINTDNTDNTVDTNNTYNTVSEENYEEVVNSNKKTAHFTRNVTPADVGGLYWDDEAGEYKVGEISFEFTTEDNLVLELLGQDHDNGLWCLLSKDSQSLYFVLDSFIPEKQASGTVTIIDAGTYVKVKDFINPVKASPVSAYGGQDINEMNTNSDLEPKTE